MGHGSSSDEDAGVPLAIHEMCKHMRVFDHVACSCMVHEAAWGLRVHKAAWGLEVVSCMWVHGTRDQTDHLLITPHAHQPDGSDPIGEGVEHALHAC